MNAEKTTHDSTFLVIKTPTADDNGHEAKVYFPTYEARHRQTYTPLDWACYWAAKCLAFNDLTDERLCFVCVEGRELRYTGWQPGMVYEFEDVDTREIVWSRSFEHWDH